MSSGEWNNVLSRFIEAAEKFKTDKIIRICADNPLLDMDSLSYLKKWVFNKWCGLLVLFY